MSVEKCRVAVKLLSVGRFERQEPELLYNYSDITPWLTSCEIIITVAMRI